MTELFDVENKEEGTVAKDFTQKAWKKYKGYNLYIQRKILYGAETDMISFPQKYKKKLPVVVRITDSYEKGPNKGDLLHPETYLLTETDLLTLPLREPKDGKGGIQKGKVSGYFVPLNKLEIFEREFDESAVEESK